jgi:replicative DNA helicase
MPRDQEAERILLGSVILEPKTIPDLISMVSDSDFFFDKYREIFKIIVTMAADNKEVNLGSV